MGTNKKPFYRVVVSESRLTPRARVIDTVGHYDPMKKPKAVDLDLARIEQWIRKGAVPSETVMDLVKRSRRAAAASASA
jgi:small subunit ribosomal protein S16